MYVIHVYAFGENITDMLFGREVRPTVVAKISVKAPALEKRMIFFVKKRMNFFSKSD
jgi:hypothetical protein